MNTWRIIFIYARYYLHAYLIGPLKFIFRIPGFVLFSIYLMVFGTDADRVTFTQHMAKGVKSASENDEDAFEEPNIQRFLDMSLRFAFHFWIVVALIYTLNRYF